MWTVTQIAQRDGVSKQAVSKYVRRLAEDHGLKVERNSAGAVIAVNVVEYDHLRARVADPSKAQAPQVPRAAATDETYDEALRQKTWHEAEKRRLELDELKGNLLRRDRIEQAVARCGEEIAAIADRLPNATDDLAAVVAREGSHGLRVALKSLAQRQRADMARALEQIAIAAPQAEAADEEAA